MHVIGAEEIHRLLDYPGLVAALRTMFRDGCEVPPRHHHPVGVPDAAAAADVISCATLAQEPLLRGEWLRPGTHLDLVGGFRPDMREADDEAARRALIYIDTEAALHEAGDIVQPLASGALSRDRIA